MSRTFWDEVAEAAEQELSEDEPAADEQEEESANKGDQQEEEAKEQKSAEAKQEPSSVDSEAEQLRRELAQDKAQRFLESASDAEKEVFRTLIGDMKDPTPTEVSKIIKQTKSIVGVVTTEKRPTDWGKPAPEKGSVPPPDVEASYKKAIEERNWIEATKIMLLAGGAARPNMPYRESD